MLDCLIIGDSIAVGIGQHLSQCKTYANVGITSGGWAGKFLAQGLDAKHTIISLGSNDGLGLSTSYYLKQIRENLSGRVYWVLPANSERIEGMVRDLAKKYGDVVFPIRETIYDGVHPTAREYRGLAERTKP